MNLKSISPYTLVFIIAVIVLLGLWGWDHACAKGSNLLAGRYIETRGFKMYYETYGEGDPLLIIHGNGGSIENFEHQIPYFREHYHCILADSRAQGKSADPGDSLSLRDDGR